MKKALNRRTVLRGMLAAGSAVTIPLPLLQGMLNNNGTALAQDAPLSPLYVTWFFGNGSLPGLWKPSATGAGSQWELSPQLQALANHKSYLTVISGLENKLVVGGVEHPTGSAGATTAAPINGNAVRAPSIDQLVADSIAEGSPYRSIELGVTPATPNGPQHSLHSVSHSGPNATNSPEFDPRALFERLFPGGGQPASDPVGEDQASKVARVRASVLDSVLEDGARLQQRLGMADRQRLEQHLEAIRAIELRLEAVPAMGTPAVACDNLTEPAVGPDTASEGPPEVNTAMVELSTLALACGQTRVLTYTFSLPAAHVYYRHLADMNDDFHDTICHGDAGDESNQPRVDRGVQYVMGCLDEFLASLASTPHGAGNLLDAALVYITSDTAWGKIHTRTEWPVILAGKAAGRLRGDEHHNFQDESLSRALLTVAQTFDSGVSEIGLDNGLATSVLPGIVI